MEKIPIYFFNLNSFISQVYSKYPSIMIRRYTRDIILTKKANLPCNISSRENTNTYTNKMIKKIHKVIKVWKIKWGDSIGGYRGEVMVGKLSSE